MRKAWKSTRTWIPAMFAGACLASAGLADEMIVRSYESPNGTTYGALSVQLPRERADRGALRHVVLLDTSASQVGEHRRFSVGVLDRFLTSLPVGDEVQVLAYDVKTVSLTEGFLAPEAARQAAQAALSNRFPAGVSNLRLALDAAQQELAGIENGSILIIGDGMSVGHLLQVDEVREITSRLRDAKVPVHAFAVGSNTDLRLLGVLAQETGGFVMRDEWSRKAMTPDQAGSLLAKAAHEVVVYPKSLEMSDPDVAVLPSRPLPMRGDRETVYLTTGDVGRGDSLTIRIEGSSDVNLPVPQNIRDGGNTFLVGLWNDAAATDGIVLGLAGDWMVNFAHQAFEDRVAQLEQQGLQALALGNFETAEQIGFHLQSIDPANAKAVSLINRAGRGELMLVAQVENPVVENADPAANPAPADGAQPELTAPPAADTRNLADRELPQGASAIEQVEALRRAQGQKLQRQIETDIDEAYKLLNAGAAAQAEGVLDRSRGAVKSAGDVEPELVAQLLRRLNATLQDVRSKKRQVEALSAERQRRQAEAEATARLIDFAAERDRKLQQMVDRIRALMEDGFHGDANAFEQAEAVAREVDSDYPQSAVGTSVVFKTEAAGQLDKANRLRSLRADRFLETLYQTELSHVPFPDEPPLRYPPAEVWWALTELRQKWKNVDLRSNSPNEQKIKEALDQITSFEFPANPLSDVIRYVSEQHGIPIIFDPSVQEAGIDPETEQVEMVLSGITLRSALKLMLEKIQGSPLTYIIEDEVMKIIDSTIAEERLTTRVYPVADLVISPATMLQNVQSSGGQNGGQLGGFGGGQQGGLGGQQGGFGGGQQGGFGGGGGQNFFSVPAQAPNEDPAKKKPAH